MSDLDEEMSALADRNPARFRREDRPGSALFALEFQPIFHISAPVVDRVHEAHKTKTLRGEQTLDGSVHQPELTEFAGLVTATTASSTSDPGLRREDNKGRNG